MTGPAPARATGAVGWVPAAIITGFLGSGKTTLLNRLLTGEGRGRVAVLVNDFGELGIDADLVLADRGDVIELANGCVCCSTQGDLLGILNTLVADARPWDALVVETSGLADPIPVIAALQRFAGSFRLDAVIGVIDAARFDENLEAAEVAFNQMVYSDLLLLNKVDLVDEDLASRMEQGMRRLNARARVIRCVRCEVPPALLFETRAAERGDLPDAHAHADDVHGGFESISLATARRLDPDSLDEFVRGLPVNVYRAKGVVWLAGRAAAQVVHVVGDRAETAPADRSPSTAESRLVVIGKRLDRDTLRAGFERCVTDREG